MVRMIWGDEGSRQYISGIDRGVIFPNGSDGIPWNGLVSVVESEDNFTAFDQFVDGFRTNTQKVLGSFKATLTAYTTPDVIFDMAGHKNNLYSGQFKESFGLSYRTYVGKGSDPDSSYQIHLVYNVHVKLTNRMYKTNGNTDEPVSLSWDISASPTKLDSYVASAHFMVDSALVHDWTLKELEDILYGSDEREPRLPSIDEIVDIFEDGVVLTITDHGDGTWTAEGPSEAIQMIDSTTFRITWPSAIYINSTTYQISSL